MRMLLTVAGISGVALAAIAGWVGAQPVDTTRLRVDGATRTFKRAPQVRLVETQAARTELTLAKQRPAALALRQSLAQTATARVNLAAVDRTALPVLVSARPTLAANLRVFARPDSFSASTSEPGLTLVIDGTKTATAAPRTFRLPSTMTLRPVAATAPVMRRDAVAARAGTTLSPAAAAKAEVASPKAGTLVRPPRPPVAPPAAPPAPTLENVVIERVEYGVDVSFTRFGAVYNVSIDCARPETDFNCSDAGARALIAQLETIGGGPAR